MSSPVIELMDVVRVYPLPSGDVTALSGVSLRIDEGEFVAIMGPSGSGKSTLLNQIGCLDRPTSGDLSLAGKNTREMDDRELTNLRLSSIGYIFQKFNLIPLLSAYENVEYPYIMKHRKNDDTGRVRDLLAMMGIDENLSAHKPNELSGGQQQRVAIARALVNDPAILLCDEPTGNLDSQTSLQIMEILADLHRRGRTLVMVTHNPETATYADRIITIRDGQIA
ncbi:MAG TPA: ABC transporter ATP-binding protein [Methanoculleus sp.]|jgi:putative ABC transport system ATP-binding protein|uniref:ABC transporter ATP-binding protein n=1 Tax=Methanoculleus sp. TaxID=90427 RepID=UPI002C18CE02|nr:ABC transporter ATP-binding protein [Methanoculleus sp.]HNT08868.1 ABC transporter ATP-binding protein [Methanoculleus sp.]HNV39844.1 ABC transporter ATP-binding protein [Methanoculleus sp.]HOF97400.1 ABC transporter ATP-binding protein [Methanoculleus sp.]HOS66993.1 ABC transporter ATP-binding protein [Methanoculleus sp.]HPK81901.1 ABC transporter ATP-binding protein [Methanoculleus sp.]